ncbi:nucleoside-diphosphate sugar epimerase/dehydratase [Methyloparacoccus murrellii]
MIPAKLRLRSLVFLHDLVMVVLAWLGAYWLRFNLSLPPPKYVDSALETLPVVLLVQLLVFSRLGLYRGVWRFASVPDLIRIGKSALVGVALLAVALYFYNRLEDVPRSVPPLYVMLLGLLLAGPRLIYRMWKDQGIALVVGRRTLVVGAGRAAELLVRDLLRARDSRFIPVALVDDDPGKKGSEIHGVRVRGPCELIPALVERLEIEAILIAVPSATDREMRRIVETCEGTGIPFLTLPSVQDMLAGQMAGNLREVSIEDLLGRTPVQLDRRAVQAHVAGVRILVTGGGGSIGSELCKQIARFAPAELVIFEQCEYNLYRIEQTLRRSFPDLRLVARLGDVTDRLAVERAMLEARPDILFHAAAYKHVPLLQGQARQAVRNNVIGTRIVAEAACAAGVRQFVLISTDKAVRPTNVMGATKRAAEKLVQSLNGDGGTRFITVRFGNVLDSAGSVVPLFREQIRGGGPVTVTHPEVTRYFMTIPEACQLIMQAAAVGQGGEIFVLDMGEPVSIRYLAEQMIRLSGKRVGEDVAIDYVGLRPGEKLTEELFLDDERPMPTPHAKLLLARSVSLERAEVGRRVEALDEAVSRFDEAAVLGQLRALVPEFVDAPAAAGLPEPPGAAGSAERGGR